MCIIKSVTRISICTRGRLNDPRGSVSADEVCLQRLVDAEEQLGGLEVAQVLHAVRAGVLVVVPSFAVVAETVRVLQTQIEALAPDRGPSIMCSWEQHLKVTVFF